MCPSFRMGTQLSVVWLVASMATVAGAVGTGFESATSSS